MKKFSVVNGGRKAIYQPEHPKANNRGYIPYSRFLVETKLGRFLSFDECVHHVNGNEYDDRIENLEVVSRSEHTRLHWKDGTFSRKLDYQIIQSLCDIGLGYKNISKLTGYNVNSVKSACRIIKRG